MEEPMMTQAQRDELKTLAGELLTQEGAQHFIDDLKKQLAELK